MAFFSFSQDHDSSLNSDEGRQKLLNAGILSTEDVGRWIGKQLKDYLHQDDVARRLLDFLNQYNVELKWARSIKLLYFH